MKKEVFELIVHFAVYIILSLIISFLVYNAFLVSLLAYSFLDTPVWNLPSPEILQGLSLLGYVLIPLIIPLPLLYLIDFILGKLLKFKKLSLFYKFASLLISVLILITLPRNSTLYKILISIFNSLFSLLH